MSGRPPEWERIETEHDKSIKKVLIELYNLHGSQSVVAEKLGVHQSTVSHWKRALGLKTRMVLVDCEANES